MTDRRFDLDSARRAAERGETALWVGDLLASRGSDNEILAAALALREHWWIGPIEVPLDDLVRLAGPEDDALVPIDDDVWEDDISAMEESVEDGWDPPPLLAEYQDGRLLLQDGNHRYEAMTRSGKSSAWVLIYFDGPDRTRGVSALPGGSGPTSEVDDREDDENDDKGSDADIHESTFSRG